MRLVQITAGVAHGDAVTNYVLALDQYLKKSGRFRSTRIYAETISGLHNVGHLSTYTARPDDFIVYHHSVGLLYLDNFLYGSVRPLLIYHNITPASFYVDWNFRAAARMQLGQDQLLQLARLHLRSVALSEFSANELRAAGFDQVLVFPYPHIEPKGSAPFLHPATGDLRWKSWLQDDVPIILFVGRIAPNKRLDLLIETFAKLRKLTTSRLLLVGSLPSKSDSYGNHLFKLVKEQQLDDDVCWAGYVSDDELASIYKKASLYMSMSQHEGFGVPLVEAMRADVAVLAHCSLESSVGEILGGAGIGFTVLDTDWAADVACRILSNQQLRKLMIDGQRRRVAELQSVDAFSMIGLLIDEELTKMQSVSPQQV